MLEVLPRLGKQVCKLAGHLQPSRPAHCCISSLSQQHQQHVSQAPHLAPPAAPPPSCCSPGRTSLRGTCRSPPRTRHARCTGPGSTAPSHARSTGPPARLLHMGTCRRQHAQLGAASIWKHGLCRSLAHRCRVHMQLKCSFKTYGTAALAGAQHMPAPAASRQRLLTSAPACPPHTSQRGRTASHT
jgi:hypothetical protein